jgi:hypothetical protein
MSESREETGKGVGEEGESDWISTAVSRKTEMLLASSWNPSASNSYLGLLLVRNQARRSSPSDTCGDP